MVIYVISPPEHCQIHAPVLLPEATLSHVYSQIVRLMVNVAEIQTRIFRATAADIFKPPSNKLQLMQTKKEMYTLNGCHGDGVVMVTTNFILISEV